MVDDNEVVEVGIIISKRDFRLLQKGELKILNLFKEVELNYLFGDRPSEYVLWAKIIMEDHT